MKTMVFLLGAGICAAQQPPARILIAYYSGTGNTNKLARAIRTGAESVAGVEVSLSKTSDFKACRLRRHCAGDAGALVEPLGRVEAVPGCSREALWKAKVRGDGRTAGAFCTCGHRSMGKDVARLAILSAFLTMRFVAVGGVESEVFGRLGPEATTGPSDPGVSEGDLQEARQFGGRFARLTLKVRKRE